MARKSWLPEGGQNLFQGIKAIRAEAEENGVKILNLAIGQPQGPALHSARWAAERAVASDEESMHEYQDNGSPGVPGFAEAFVQFHTGDLLRHDVAYLPIPGIKPMLGLIPLACGCANQDIGVVTTTNPGYPTPADWCAYLPNVNHCAPKLHPGNEFRFDASEFLLFSGRSLIMMNYPHNPSGQVASWKWLVWLCGYCEEKGIRLFNDAAYAGLAHTDECATLSEVAVRHPGLSWAEAFSASKIIGNGTGWRVGAMAGSPDFIADIATIKGNTDSGFVAPMAAGVQHAITNGTAEIERCRIRYHERIGLLVKILSDRGMRLAVEPGAGFFTLWKTPTQAFGVRIENAQHFNYLMIEKTGVTGVHFHPYTRYAVVGPVEEMADDIRTAFDKAKVSYD